MTAVFRRGCQPEHTLCRGAYLCIIREKQLAQGVLGDCNILRRPLSKTPHRCLHHIGNHHYAVPVELTHLMLIVGVAMLRQLPHLLHGIVALVQGTA